MIIINKSLIKTIAFLVIFTISTNSESAIIKGTITDDNLNNKLQYVTCTLQLNNLKTITVSDTNGFFLFENLKTGVAQITFISLGYFTFEIGKTELLKDDTLIFDIKMRRKENSLSEVVISGNKTLKNFENEMILISAKQISFEETSKYSGTLNDPARIVSGCAGVINNGDMRNDIIVRGNSPMGIQWKLDDVYIPNPNHFGNNGSTGGPISILNTNTLKSSDFLVSAFPAEYSNAISGVFDLKLKTGNFKKTNFTAQVGFNGFETGLEGPLIKNKKFSYLINYRYSTLSVLKYLGVNFGLSAVPDYQDLTFKLNFPISQKLGVINLFGIGGKSKISILESEKNEKDVSFSEFGEDIYAGSDLSLIGFQHKLFFNNNSSQIFTIAKTLSKDHNKIYRWEEDESNKSVYFFRNTSESRYSVSYKFIKTYNLKNSINTGFNVSQINAEYIDSINIDNVFRNLNNFKGKAVVFQNYFQLKKILFKKFQINTGLNFQYFTLNNTKAIEPRVSLKYKFKNIGLFTFGFGMHSQIQPINVYYYAAGNNDKKELTNKNLDFSRSIHLVLGYEKNIKKYMVLKSEIYFQHLYNIPVESRKSFFSMLNAGNDFNLPFADSLVSNGLGNNYGIDLTIDNKFLNNSYLLINASLYNSKYNGSDNIKRNTAFNGNYLLNFIAGHEFILQNNQTISLNSKFTFAGGRRYIEVNLNESIEQNKSIYKFENAYENKFYPYSRLDIKIAYCIKTKKSKHETGIDIQNILNSKNVWQQMYNAQKKEVVTQYQMGLFPVVFYKLMI